MTAEISRTLPLLEKHFASLAMARERLESGDFDAARESALYARDIFPSREADEYLHQIEKAGRNQDRRRLRSALAAAAAGAAVLMLLSSLRRIAGASSPARGPAKEPPRSGSQGDFCEPCLAASTPESPPDVSSTGGLGAEFFGRSRPCPNCGSVVRTLWWTALLPAVPRDSYRYLDLGLELDDDSSKESFRARRVGLRWGQVAGIYAADLLVLALLAGAVMVLRRLELGSPMGRFAWVLLAAFPPAAAFLVRLLAGGSAADRRPLARRYEDARRRLLGTAPPPAPAVQAEKALRLEAWKPPSPEEIRAGFHDPARALAVVSYCLGSGRSADFIAIVQAEPSSFQRAYARSFLLAGDYDSARRLWVRAEDLSGPEQRLRDFLNAAFARRPSAGGFTEQNRYLERLALAEELARGAFDAEAAAVAQAAPERQRVSLAAACLRGGSAQAALQTLESMPRTSWSDKEFACAARALHRLGKRAQARSLLAEARSRSVTKK